MYSADVNKLQNIVFMALFQQQQQQQQHDQHILTRCWHVLWSTLHAKIKLAFCTVPTQCNKRECSPCLSLRALVTAIF